jgi:hypothetical protein
MRQFLIAFVCLSTIAMAQTVVVAMPLSADPVPAMSANSEASSSAFVPSATPLGGKVQEPATMMLLVLGLSGLTAVSGRNHARKKPVSP